jgi:hypothetical protein
MFPTDLLAKLGLPFATAFLAFSIVLQEFGHDFELLNR